MVGPLSTRVNGDFSITIDANGSVKGSFTGSVSGTVTGQVDLNGKLSATGMTSGGILPGVKTTWSGNVSVSGNSLSVQGNWSVEDSMGTFSGTGNVSK